MEITCKDHNDITIISLSGEIDLYNTRRITETINQLVEAGKNKVIIDFEKVPYIDSSGIGTLLGGRKKLLEKDGNIVLINVQNSIMEVFKLMQIEDFISMFNSDKEAIDSFG